MQCLGHHYYTNNASHYRASESHTSTDSGKAIRDISVSRSLYFYIILYMYMVMVYTYSVQYEMYVKCRYRVDLQYRE